MTKEKVFISEADQYLFAQGTHYDIYKNWVHICRWKTACKESISEYGHQMQHR